METKMNINSIYHAPEGEGIFIGTPQVFVRFQGCHIGCLNCDSIDTWDFDAFTPKTLSYVVAKVREFLPVKRVSITGGDPLHPKLAPQVLALVAELKADKYFINIEAAGVRIDHQLFDIVDFISFDFKTPSTGVKTPLNNILKMAHHYSQKFQVKAVIENEKDFQATLNAYDEVRERLDGQLHFDWCLTPAFNLGESFPKERITNIYHWNQAAGSPFRVIVQQHKVIFGADRKQV